MKILLLSDSHGNKINISKLLSTENYDKIFFMGDGLSDFEKYNDLDITKVRGNCDLFSDEQIITFKNILNNKIMLTHGHEFKVKYFQDLMIKCAHENNCNILCFGHTHKQKCEYVDGILTINPGAFKNNHYAILDIDEITHQLSVTLKSFEF